MDKLELSNILYKLYKTNELLRKPSSGLYVASLGIEYVNYVWIRDVYYQSKVNLKKEPELYIQTYRSLLDYYKGLNYKYDNKVDHLIRKPFPLNNIRFIHPRFYPNLCEITGDWGNLQLDTFGYFFLGISEGIKSGLEIIRDDSDIDIINKLIKVLYKIQYWNIKDNGIWEENEEIHASSIGAIVGGLKLLDECDIVIIPQKLITEGEKMLYNLLPSESLTKKVDLALLTLIYPFNILNEYTKDIVLKNVHKYLEKGNGVIRYIGDKYYNVNGESEWTFGLSYLFLSYIETDTPKAEKYLKKLISLVDDNGYIPELFYSCSNKPNVNNPLGWSVAMAILCIEKYLEIKG